MTARERILTIAHGHPDIISGGGEIAAYSAHLTYKGHKDVEAAWFLARADLGRGATGRIRRHRPGEYLWEQGLRNGFTMKAANLHEITGYFAELVRKLRPTVVHTHHFFNLGLEYLKVLKDIDPSTRLVLTLHEYIAICPNAGLMMNPDSGDLCESGAYDRHLKCAPDKTPEDLWLRKHRFESYFAFVDLFVAPSAFLRDRYIEWGVPPEKISVIRNGQPPRDPLDPRPIASGEGRNRFAFFGQLSQHKGVDVLFRALSMMSPEMRRNLTVEVHGANLEYQPKRFRDELRELARPLLAEGTLVWCGSYSAAELPQRMAPVDWVLVPSVWYENAPLVIQEAFGFGRPVIVSDLGGMREAVESGGGLRLPRGNPKAWSRELARLASSPDEWDRQRARIPRPITLTESIDAHLSLFARLDPVAV